MLGKAIISSDTNIGGFTGQEHYNNDSLHNQKGYLPPVEFVKGVA